MVAITKNGARRHRRVRDRRRHLASSTLRPNSTTPRPTAFLLTFQTSHLALFRRGRLQAGETLVVHSAASGLGTAGIQLGKAAGARVIAVAGGPEKTALCARWAPTWSIDHTAEDFVEAVLAGDRRRGRRRRSTTWPAATSSSARGGAPPTAAATWRSGSPTTTTTA